MVSWKVAVLMVAAVVLALFGLAFAEGNFTGNGDGTVTDNETGLVWQQVPTGGGMTWINALAHCEALDLAGYTDWRLPNIKELQSIVDHSETSPAWDEDYFDGDDDYYWSSTTRASSLGYAWDVRFFDGHVYGGHLKGTRIYARCVRGGL